MNAPARAALVTGGAGLVGSHACRALAASGWRVRALVRDRAKAERRLRESGAELVTGDLRTPGVAAAALRGCDAIVHCAAIAIETRGQRYEEVNTAATIALLDAARAAGVPRFVHLSQNGASSASPSRFLRSKGVAEDAVRASDRAWTVLRPSVIVGPEDAFVNALARGIRLTPFVFPLPGGGGARMQPVMVGDVAKAIDRCLSRDDTVRKSYAVGGPSPLTLREITQTVLRALRTRRALVGVPVPLLRPVVAIAERLFPAPPVTTGLLALLDEDNVTPDDLSRALGITPTPFTPDAIAYVHEYGVIDSLTWLLRR